MKYNTVFNKLSIALRKHFNTGFYPIEKVTRDIIKISNQEKLRMLKRICKELFGHHNEYGVCKLYIDCMDCPVGKKLNKIRSEK